MTEENKSVKNFPNLRFPGFEGDWETVKLGDITSWSSGGTPSKDNQSFWNGEIPWITASSMRGLVYSDSELKITEAGLLKGSRLAKKGSLLILVRGSMLFNKVPIGIVSRDVAFNQDVKSIVVGEKSFSEYVLYWFLAFEPKILNIVSGTGIGAGKLDLHDLKLLECKIPNHTEQKKISEFLSLINNRITSSMKIIEQLTSQMLNLKDLIFEQQLRFKDDKENEFPNWQKSKLEDICEKQSSSISANKIEDNIGDYPIYGATGILKNIDFYEVENDYVSIIKDGAGVGRLLYCKGRSSVLGTLDIIKSKHVNLYFIFLLLSRIDFKKYITGSTIPHIYFKDYKKEKVQIPSLKEQERIANFFKSLDDKINIENSLLIQYKNQKKYLLQNLFV